MRIRRRSCAAVLAAALLVPTGGCSTSPGASTPDLRGVRLEVLGSWYGTEQARFTAVLRRFADATGATVRYTRAGGYLPDVLDARVARHDPPDVAVLPQPGLLRRYVAVGALVPLDADTARTVRSSYGAVWQSLGTVSGTLYGVWFKAAHKSLIWYDAAAFERAGVVAPTGLPGLLRIVATLRRQGIVPFSVGAGRGDAWTLTDWFENLYLRLAGPAAYDRLTAHTLAWTDPSVTRTLQLMHRLLAPANLLGGVRGTLGTGFDASVVAAFARPGRVAMVAEGDFVAAVVAAHTRQRVGADVDAFAFPGSYRGLPVVVGGGDVVVQMRRTAAAARLMRWFASPAAAAVWAAAGGFVSPNLDLDLAVYPDPLSRAVARSLVEAGNGFRFDLSDREPAAFGSAPTSGMQGALARFLVDGDVGRAQRTLEAAATRAGPP